MSLGGILLCITGMILLNCMEFLITWHIVVLHCSEHCLRVTSDRNLVLTGQIFVLPSIGHIQVC